jgi:pilus assembly protein CpaE
MSLLLFGSVTVVGARDRDLEVMLSSAGMRTSAVPASELVTLAHPAARPAPVLVVDLRDNTQFPASLAQLKRHHPQTAVVVVAQALDPALMLAAMRAGVSECVVEPISEADLRAAITRVAQHVDPPAAGEIFAIVGAKGGVGTTTVAVNLATELAKEAGEQTLLVDLHPCQGDAAVMFGAEPHFTVADALQNTHRLDEAVFRSLVTPTRTGVHLLASPLQWEAGRIDPDGVRTLLGVAARLYRYIVVDVPRAHPAVIDAFASASRLVVVANQELSTIRHASRMVGTLQERFGRDLVTVVVSRFDASAEIRREDVEQVVKLRITHVIPSDYRIALRAQNVGRPLALDNQNKLTPVFRQLARDLAGLREKPVEAAAGSRLFGRLGGRRS